MQRVPEILTNMLMPPFGVAEAIALVDSRDAFAFWLQTHTDTCNGPRFWRTAVMRECLPDPDSELTFVALSPIIRERPRTALVRVAVGELQ